jgi:peptidyl-prolyl cis-trans isomerase SDCCAG10
MVTITDIRPPKIRGIRIIENPFDDIIPRITIAEKKAQAQARIEAKKEADLREKRSRAKKWVLPYYSGDPS